MQRLASNYEDIEMPNKNISKRSQFSESQLKNEESEIFFENIDPKLEAYEKVYYLASMC